MLSIRLKRIGKKKQPQYRLIVTDKKRDPWGKYLESLGNYNPLTDPATINLKTDRIEYWLSQGAQPSNTVHNLLVEQKVIKEDKKRIVKISKKRQSKIDAAEEEKKTAEALAEETPKEPADSPPKAEQSGGPATMPPEAALGGEKAAKPKAEEKKEELKEKPKKEEEAKVEAPAEETPKEEAAKEENKK